MANEPQQYSECQDCGKEWRDEQLVSPIPDLEMRVAPREPMPSGECPECGALCQSIGGREEKRYREAAERLWPGIAGGAVRRTGQIEVPNWAAVSIEPDNGGAQVQVWVWVGKIEL